MNKFFFAMVLLTCSVTAVYAIGDAEYWSVLSEYFAAAQDDHPNFFGRDGTPWGISYQTMKTGVGMLSDSAHNGSDLCCSDRCCSDRCYSDPCCMGGFMGMLRAFKEKISRS